MGVNHCSQRYKGLARVCTESASSGESGEKFP